MQRRSGCGDSGLKKQMDLLSSSALVIGLPDAVRHYLPTRRPCHQTYIDDDVLKTAHF